MHEFHQEAFEIFKNYLRDIAILPEETWARITQIVQYQKASKKDILLKGLQIENHVRFLTSGVVKITHHTSNSCYVYDFRGADSFLSDTVSFFERKPTTFSMEALTDCEWLEMSYDDMNQLMQEDEMVRLYAARSINLYLEKRHEKEDFLRSNSAKERYDLLLETFPDILQIASLGDIASYMGITQQSLSRIRKMKA
jgi:CRP-like cAMP-binding protein